MVPDELASVLCDKVATFPVGTTKVITKVPSVEDSWAPCGEVVVDTPASELVELRL